MTLCAQELELLELRGEHAQLMARFGEARANMEEALEARRRCAAKAERRALKTQTRALTQVKDRTIDALAAALDAREEALERHAASAASLEVRSG